MPEIRTTIPNMELDVSLPNLLKKMLNKDWISNCFLEFVYPKAPTNAANTSVSSNPTSRHLFIRYDTEKKGSAYLRYQNGPIQGYYWGSFGDDFQDIETATIALSQAPAPPATPWTLDFPTCKE